MRDHGVGSWIERRARIAPDRTALVHGDSSVTYSDLANRVERLAHGLRELGVARGDRVSWMGPNHPAFLEALFASAKLGAVLAPVNHRLEHDMLNRVLDDDAPTIVIVEETVAAVPQPACASARVVVGHATGADIGYTQLVSDAGDDPIDEVVGLDDLCMIPHTSGTMGKPRGVMLTHGNVTWNVSNVLSLVDLHADDVTVAIAPFFRTGGTGVNVLPVLFKGGTVVLPETTDADEILRLVARHRVTVGFGNPDLLTLMTASPRWAETDLSSIRVFMTGGAPVPERLIHTYTERGVVFVQGYGLSEAAPVVLLLDGDSAPRKVGSAGKPPMFVDVRTVRPDGTDCAEGETGELLVSGPNVMAGYWNDEEATQRVLDEGWLRTGDAARIDDEGFVWIVDRLGDAFVSSDQTVYPGEIERVLLQHPAVADAGVASRDGGIVAFVVLGAGERASVDELIAFCRDRLVSHQVPTSVTFVGQLPRSSVGKLLRHEL